MAYYWFAKNIPELQEFAVVDRREWLRAAEERSRPRYFRWVSVLIVTLVVLVSGQFQVWLHLGFLSVVPVTAFVAAVALIWDVAYQQPRARQWLREHLREFRTDDPPVAGAKP